MNIETSHQTIQNDVALKPAIQNESDDPITVFTDVPNALATLTDPRFQIVENIAEAKICWLIGLDRNTHKATAIGQNSYLNDMPSDECLLIKDLFIPLIQNSYKCFSRNGADIESVKGRIIPETYLVQT